MLISQIISREEQLPGHKISEIKEWLRINLIKEETNNSVNETMQESYSGEFSAIIDLYCTGLLLESPHRIEELCELIRQEGLKMKISDEWMAPRLMKLKEKMLRDLGPAQGAYRTGIKKFNADVRLDEDKITEYFDLYVYLLRSFKRVLSAEANAELPEYSEKMLCLVADFIIEKENRNFFDRSAIISILKAHPNFPKRIRPADPEKVGKKGEMSDKRKRKYMRMFQEIVDELIKNNYFPRSEIQFKAINTLVERIFETRPKLDETRNDLWRKIDQLIDSDYSHAARDLRAALEKSNQKDFETLEEKHSPEVIPSLSFLNGLCVEFKIEASSSYQLPLPLIETKAAALRQKLEQKYRSDENLKAILKEEFTEEEEIKPLFKALESNDLAGLIVKIKAVRPLFKNTSLEVNHACAILITKRINLILEQSFKPTEMRRQHSDEVKAADREIEELRIRFRELPPDMQADKKFRRQYDLNMGNLSRRRGALLHGTENVVKFFTEYQPETLHKNLEEMFQSFYYLEGLAEVWSRLAEMSGGEAAYTKGANPEWNKITTGGPAAIPFSK